MSFLEDLPSVSSSIYSGKDIELFDKRREEYRRTVNTLKYISARTQIIINVDLMKERITKPFDERSRDRFEEMLSKKISSRDDFWPIENHSYYNLSPPPEKGYLWYKKLVENPTYYKYYKTHKRGEVHTGYFNDISGSNQVITAFYIPNDLEWLKLFYRYIRDPPALSNDILVGYYRKGHRASNEDLPLESILARSKDFAFLENDGTNLELLLENSKQGALISSCPDPNSKKVEICGKKYKRITLVQPGIFWFNKGLEILRIGTPTQVSVYVEKIKMNYYDIFDDFTDHLCLCDLGPKGYKLLKI